VIFATFVTPADIAVTTDSLGATLAPFEVASYTATTGAIEIYVNLSISHTTDTMFYISFGNTSQTTSLCDIVHTWNSAFVLVAHNSSLALSGANITQTLDSTLNDNYLTHVVSSYTKTTGVAGDGLLANDSSSTLFIATTVNFPVGTSARTFEYWINTANTKCPNGVKDVAAWGLDSTDQLWGFYCSDNTYGSRNTMVLKLFSDDGVPSTDFPQDSNWHHVVAAYPSGQTQVQFGLMYLDGAALTPTFTHPTNTLNTGNGSQGNFGFGYDPHSTNAIAMFSYDEIRISNVNRSADWLLATYNNFHAPGSFVTVSNATATAAPPPFGIIAQ
jgi:hypothetical protein